FLIEGAALGTGKHVLRLTKKGPGALYASTRLTYFSEEEPIPAAGHEIKIDRRYFLLRKVPYEVEVQGSKGEKVMERRLRYERVPLKPGDPVTSGDVIQVELELTSDND